MNLQMIYRTISLRMVDTCLNRLLRTFQGPWHSIHSHSGFWPATWSGRGPLHSVRRYCAMAMLPDISGRNQSPPGQTGSLYTAVERPRWGPSLSGQTGSPYTGHWTADGGAKWAIMSPVLPWSPCVPTTSREKRGKTWGFFCLCLFHWHIPRG